MDIRNLIIDKKYEMDLVKYGEGYTNDTLVENFTYDDFDITIEGIGEKLSDMKNKVVDTLKKLWEKVKKWLLKVFNNLKIMVTPGAKLASQYGDRLIKLYREKANSITVNSMAFNIDEDGIDEFIDEIAYGLLSVTEYVNRCMSGGHKVEGSECSFLKDKILIVDDDAKVSRGGVLHFIKPCVIDDDTIKQRKLSDAIDIHDFHAALKGDDELKRIKKITTDLESQFKTNIDKIKDIDVINSLETGEEVQVDKESLATLIKFANAYCKASTCAVDCYMSYFKEMHRFVMVVVKKMLKKYGTKDDVEEKVDDGGNEE